MPSSRAMVLTPSRAVRRDANGRQRVALPSIGAEPGASLSGHQQVVDGYAVPFAALLLASGTLDDRYGHRRLVVIDLLAFAAGSAGYGPAVGTGTLVAARPLRVWPPQRWWRRLSHSSCTPPPTSETGPRPSASWSALGGLVLAAGSLLGGLLVSGPGWRVGVPAESPQRGSPSGGSSAVVVPALPLALFQDRRFTMANAVAVVVNLVGIGTVFGVTLYLRVVQQRWAC